MSFVKKAVKKVFKVAKKVVKSKWFKVAAIVGLSLFTAGIAAGGWAGFSAAFSTAGGGIGGFFSAVGTTMATGWTSVIGGLKAYGAGAKSFLTSQATAGAGVGGFETGVGGVLSSGGAVAGEGVFSAAAQAAATSGVGGGVAGLATSTLAPALATTSLPATTASQGWLGRVFGGLTSNTVGGSMLRGGIAMGINGYFSAKERERDEFYFNNRTVWGGAAFGGESAGMNLLSPQARPDETIPQPSVAMQESRAPVGQMPVQQAPGAGLLPQVAAPQAQPAAVGPSQVTQPPPATQPQQGRAPAGVTPEMLGVI